MNINLDYAKHLATLHMQRDRLLTEARRDQRPGSRAELYLSAASVIQKQITEIETNFIGSAAI